MRAVLASAESASGEQNVNYKLFLNLSDKYSNDT